MKKLLLNVAITAFVFGFAHDASAAQITVKNGDSMWLIAQRYKVSFAEVLRLNSHYKDVNMIHAGDKINIPDGSHGANTATNSNSDNIHQGNDSAILGSVEAKEKAVLQLVNKERKANGLNELTQSTKLISLAEMKSKDMAEKNYFSHTSPTYGTPFEMLQKYGVSYRSAGENIAAGQKTAEEVMKAWMNSSGHRANILNPSYTQIGIGYYAGGSYRTYWTQLFTGS
ncbi:CAP domain-containing protein [Solibacillus silvestris]